jgi:hypothetical protein
LSCRSPERGTRQLLPFQKILELKSPSSRFGHSFASLTRPCLRLTLALDAGWFIVPAALSFRKHPILLNFAGKPFDGTFK